MNNEIKIHATGTDVRIGTLPNLIQRAPFNFKGNIRAPFAFFSSKYVHSANDESFHFPLSLMAVLVSRGEHKITFIEDIHNDSPSCNVTGEISITKELQSLGINQVKKYSGTQLSDMLRFSRLLFTSSDECIRVVNALRDFKAKVEADIESADDKKGNKSTRFDQRIHQPHDLKFNLSWPVISGEPKVTFMVEINYDVRDRAIEFWLESVEMHEAISGGVDALLDEQITLFKGVSVTVIEQ